MCALARKPRPLPHRFLLVLPLLTIPLPLSPLGQLRPAAAQSSPALTPARAAELRATIEKQLETELTTRWYPSLVEPAPGGFRQNAARDWSLRPDNGAFLVYQARMIWTAAAYAEFQPERRDAFLAHARHGLDFIDQVMSDPDHGAYFFEIGPDHQPPPGTRAPKHTYGLAFVIYAAARLREVGGDERALHVARNAFDWLEAHGHDAAHGGYFESFTREGHVVQPDPRDPPNQRLDVLGQLYGFKSMNAHIHMLEALAALARVDDRPIVRTRLSELHQIVRDRIAAPPGVLNLYFSPEWQAVPGHDSYGHDVETAYLLLEAAEILGAPHDPKTLTVARSLVDHALDLGWDDQHGGFYDHGDTFQPATDTKKVWWTQAEGLNALLLMHRTFGHETDRYAHAFLKQWDFIAAHQIDPQFGGWFEETTREGRLLGDGTKAQPWKANYHHGRALMNVARMLREIEHDAAHR